MSNAQTTASRASTAWQINLWIAQILLATLFGTAGTLKLFWAPADLAAVGLAWTVDVPLPLLRLIGTVELLGAIGVILPALTRILPFLTPLAIGFHATRGETAAVLPLNIGLLALSLVVIWGRFRKAPIKSRG